MGEFAPDEGCLAGRPPVDQGGSLGCCGMSGMHQLLQCLECLGCRRRRLRSHHVGEDREHFGIDRVGFGARAEGLGEEACAQRVDDGHGKARLAERAVGAAVIFGCRLHHDARDRMARQFSLETFDAVAIVDNPKAPAHRVEMDIETVFTDVDADIHW